MDIQNHTSLSITIGRLAKRTGCSIDNIRYYESVGLLPKVSRTPSGHRLYGHSHFSRLVLIRQCRSLGFSLAEIKHLLDLIDNDQCRCQEVERFLEAHIQAVRHNIERLRAVESILKKLAQQCADNDNSCCPAIGYFYEQHNSLEPLGYLSVSVNLTGPGMTNGTLPN